MLPIRVCCHRLLRATGLLALAVVLGGCGGLFSGAGQRLATNLTAAMADNDDPEIVRQGSAAYLLLLDALVAEVAAAGGEVVEMDEDILARVTGKDNPQAVAGVFAEFDTGLAGLHRGTAKIWLVAQALRDPGNLGTMLRTGDAVGAGGLILVDDCADPFSVEAVRASMGAVFTQAIAQARWSEFIAWLRQGAGQLVAASLRDATDYRTAAYQTPCFLMVGNESRGLPQDYEDACDLRVTLPMLGRADSLNAAVAGAVLAYEALAHLRG